MHSTLFLADRATELHILVGLQASGKSTFYRAYFAPSNEYIYVSKDRLRNNRQPEQRQRQLIAEALAAGRSVVVDNTNAMTEARAALVELGRAYGAAIVGYAFESSARASVERNRGRTGRARVPDVAIYATAKRLTPPTYAEGFDRLYTVRITEDGTFLVRQM